jgi:hypothetical protein
MIHLRRGTAATVCAAMLVMGVQHPARAEVVVGGGAGVAQLSGYNDLDDAFAWRGFIGYRAADIPLYLEAQYFETDELEIEDGDDVGLEFDGFALAVGYRVVFGEFASDLVLKGGGYVQDTRAHAGAVEADDDAQGGLLGVGGNWMLTPHLGINFDVQILFGVEDFADDEDLTIATVGLVYSFFDD